MLYETAKMKMLGLCVLKYVLMVQHTGVKYVTILLMLIIHDTFFNVFWGPVYGPYVTVHKICVSVFYQLDTSQIFIIL